MSARLSLIMALVATAAGQVTQRVSIDSLGVQGNGESTGGSISPDGRYVVFTSLSTNLVGGDTGFFSDVFVRDRQRRTTERVSISSLGTQGNGDSFGGWITSDGRCVAFNSRASNLVSGDTNGQPDIFVRDRESGTTERVNVDSFGAQANSFGSSYSMSADGRYVAFDSFASNLVPGDTNGRYDVFVRDRLSGSTERVSLSSLGAQGSGGGVVYGGSGYPAISADGRYVAFASEDVNLVSGDTNYIWDVFVRDRLNGTTERVSVDSTGVQGGGNYGSLYPSISADGRYVAFQSWSNNLVSGDTNSFPDIFVRDRLNGTTERVSVDSLGAQGAFGGIAALISANGRYVAFDSRSATLVSGDTNAQPDVFVHDRQSGATERVSLDSVGTQGNDESFANSISADGRYVTFSSHATNLVSGDTHGYQDVFVRDRSCSATSATFSGDGINADTIAPVSVVLGSPWSAPLTLGHPHGSGGPVVLRLRGSTVNGPTFPSPCGGRPTEILVAGPLYATFCGTHDGVTGGIAPQAIPNDVTLVGLGWAVQYTVIGGGYADLSQAVSGVVGCR